MNAFDKLKEYFEINGWHKGNAFGPLRYLAVPVPSAMRNSTLPMIMDIQILRSACLMGANQQIKGNANWMLFVEIVHEQFPERVFLWWSKYIAFEGSEKVNMAQQMVIAFNDHEDTTLDDVYMVLEKASVKCGEQNG